MKKNKPNIKALFVLFAIFIMMASLMEKISAEDDDEDREHEDYEREYEDDKDRDEDGREAEYEDEDEHEDDEDDSDGNWDFSDDFDEDEDEHEDEDDKGSNSGNQNPATAGGQANYTLEQVSLHNTNSNCWVVLFSKVYDITSLVNTHSGGNVFSCGNDNTGIYKSEHGTGTSRMNSYFVGNLANQQIPPSTTTSSTTASSTTASSTTTTTVPQLQETAQAVAAEEGTTQRIQETIVQGAEPIGEKTDGEVPENIGEDRIEEKNSITQSAFMGNDRKQDMPNKEQKTETAKKENLLIAFLKWLGMM